MQTTSQAIKAYAEALPEGATLADAIERLCFMAKVQEGLRQSDAAQVIPHDEVRKQFLA